jgi:hypothetical protein
MRTEAIAGVFMLFVLGGSAVAQPTAPLIPLEPEKPIEATEVEPASPQPMEAPADPRIETEPTPREAAPIPGLIEERDPSRPIESAPSDTRDQREADDPAPAETEERPVPERESEDLDSEDPGSEDSDSEDSDSEESQSSPAAAMSLPANCEPLPLVGGEGSEVTKRTSPPSFALPLPLPGPLPDPRFRSNWNTDWYIPNAQEYRHYRVVLLPHNDADYSIQLYLKYPDDTADEFYDEQDIRLAANEPLIVETEPRSNLLPYQINANIGGLLSIGVRYTVAVAGCR